MMQAAGGVPLHHEHAPEPGRARPMTIGLKAGTMTIGLKAGTMAIGLGRARKIAPAAVLGQSRRLRSVFAPAHATPPAPPRRATHRARQRRASPAASPPPG